MITNLEVCDFREFSSDNSQMNCSNPANNGKLITIDDCLRCDLVKARDDQSGKMFPEEPPPSFMAGGLFSAIGKVATGVVGVAKAAAGIDAPSLDIQKERWAICNRCDQNWLGQCKACGCFIAEKIRVKGEKCPEPFNKWGPSDA